MNETDDRAKRIIRNAARCKNCGVVLESRSRYDYVACICGNAVDGGREYLGRSGNPGDLEELSTFA